MAYSIKVREEVLKNLKGGLSIGKVSLKYGVSVSTIYKWKNSETVTKEAIKEKKEKQEQVFSIKGKASFKKLNSQVEKDIVSLEEPKMLNKKEVQERTNQLIQRIKGLKNQNLLEEALKECNDPLAESSNIIQNQKVSILVMLGKRKICPECKAYLEEALSICQRYDEHTFLLPLKNTIEKLLSAYNKKIPRRVENGTLDQWITKIYGNCIDEEEIKTAEIPEWQKEMLLIAYYEKYSKSTGIVFIKKLKKKYQEVPEKIKLLNQLLGRMNTKRTNFFDINFYARELHCRVNFQLIATFKEEYLEKESKKMEEWREERKIAESTREATAQPPKVEPSKKKRERQMITVEGERVTPRYQQSTNENAGKSITNPQETLIKDVFAEEIFQIGRELYLQLSIPKDRLRGVKAWDRLERLKEKSSNDPKALREMLNIISNLNWISPGFIKTNEKRNDQMYEELEKLETQKVKKYGTNN